MEKGTITCPNCRNKEKISIPKNVCMSFYTCPKCKNTLRAKEGCCVFCDYGDAPCPAAPHEE